MLNTVKVLAIAMVVAASASSAFAASYRDNGRAQQFENYSTSNGSQTDRDALVEQTGN